MAALSELSELIVVAGHAVYVGMDFVELADDRNWFLQSFQTGEPPFYVDHIRAGVAEAASNEQALLIFSGGQTRREAGPRSEGASYWAIAESQGWWQQTQVRERTVVEEYARDSFENLLFAICRFRECCGRYPAAVKAVGWAFKQQRFAMHMQALQFPSERFRYLGINDPPDVDGAKQGEGRALDAFRSDPYGMRPPLSEKRRERNPFLEDGALRDQLSGTGISVGLRRA